MTAKEEIEDLKVLSIIEHKRDWELVTTKNFWADLIKYSACIIAYSSAENKEANLGKIFQMKYLIFWYVNCQTCRI